jgi:alpha-N-arabinofuranosidase
VSRGRTTDWNDGKGDALRFSVEEWYELLAEADKMDSLIRDHWTVMGVTDRRRQVKLVVDEWGAWHKGGTEVDPTHLLGQTSTLRDALLAALTLDTFQRHADKVAMANVAQLVNCLHSLFVAHEDRFVATPNFHVFAMYAPHAGAQSLRTVFSAPSIGYERIGSKGQLFGLAGSASLKEKTLTLTVVNPHVSEARETEIAVRGASIAGGRAATLAAPDIHAHNTFEQPHALEPREETLAARGGVLGYRFAPASVTRLSLDLT